MASPAPTRRTHLQRNLPTLLAGALAASMILGACYQELALNLTMGQCVTLPEDTRIASVGITQCTAEHHAEVIAIVPLDAKNLPTAEELDSTAHTQCAQHFESYVGQTLERSSLELKWLAPSEASWKTGDRSLACLATAPGMQPLTASVKDSQL